MVNFFFTIVIHVPDLFSQISLYFQILQSSLFVCFSKDSCWKLFIDSNCPRWNLNSCFGNINMAENE